MTTVKVMDTTKIEQAYLGLLKTGINPYSKKFKYYIGKPPKCEYIKYNNLPCKNEKVIEVMAYIYANILDAGILWDAPAYASDYVNNGLVAPDFLAKALADRGYKRAPISSHQFTFIDLFAGIGGFRLALERRGGRCVFSSEFEPNARYTYFNHFGEYPFGDILQYGVQDDGSTLVPSHDILTAGFPCQPFSVAGKRQGFNDARGTLFFEILKIVNKLKPKAIILENVSNLRNHDDGRTFNVIYDSLTGEGYKVYDAILNAKDFGVPQRRKRIFIVAFRDECKFNYPTPVVTHTQVGHILEKNVDAGFTLSDKLWHGHQNRKVLHKASGKGFTYTLVNDKSIQTNTLTARYGKDGKEILVAQHGKNPRMLTPRECARLQGYPDSYELPLAKSVNYKLLGNSVAIPVVESIVAQVLLALSNTQVTK